MLLEELSERSLYLQEININQPKTHAKLSVLLMHMKSKDMFYVLNTKSTAITSKYTILGRSTA
jgi:hypothetical protein